jgi:hypothetical protein
MLATNLTFGIEIECRTPVSFDALAAAIRAKGIAVQAFGYATHQMTSGWKIVTDASLGSGGAEIVSPILKGEQGIADLMKVAEALAETGCTVDRSCGLHVHVGARGASTAQLRNVAKMFIKYEAQFDAIVAPSRRGSANRYCQSNVGVVRGSTLAEKFATIDRATTMQQVATAVNGGFEQAQYSRYRYMKCNFQSLATHGTVEFRQHQGSVDGVKMAAWVRLVTGFVATAMSVRSVAPVAGEFADLTKKVDRPTAEFFSNRRAQLNGG